MSKLKKKAPKLLTDQQNKLNHNFNIEFLWLIKIEWKKRLQKGLKYCCLSLITSRHYILMNSCINVET